MTWLLRLAARVPMPLLHAVGTVLGWFIYLGSGRFRKYLRTNLEQAGYPEAAMRRRAVAEIGKAMVELPAVWLRPHEQSAALVIDVRGWEWVERAMERRQGLILLTPHLGCWEIAAQYICRHYPLTVMYRPPKLRGLEALFRAGRTRERMKSVPADLSGVRALFRALKRGEAIGMLPDQVPGLGEGEWAPFFGRPAYTMTLAMRMAESSGASVLMLFAERLARGRGFRMHIEPLPQAQPDETPAGRVNRALEALIRRSPPQYLWAYNRYKVPAGIEPPSQAP